MSPGGVLPAPSPTGVSGARRGSGPRRGSIAMARTANHQVEEARRRHDALFVEYLRALPEEE